MRDGRSLSPSRDFDAGPPNSESHVLDPLECGQQIRIKRENDRHVVLPAVSEVNKIDAKGDIDALFLRALPGSMASRVQLGRGHPAIDPHLCEGASLRTHARQDGAELHRIKVASSAWKNFDPTECRTGRPVDVLVIEEDDDAVRHASLGKNNPASAR